MRIRSKGIFQFLAPVVAVPAPLRAYGFTSLALIGDQGSGRRKEKTEGGNPHLRGRLRKRKIKHAKPVAAVAMA